MKPILRLLTYIVRHSPRTFAVAALAGLVSGATATGMVAVVNEALGDPRPVSLVLLAIPFLVLLLLSPATRLVSQYLLIRLGQDLVYDLRLELTRRLLTTPLGHLERLGPHRLLVALTDDVTSITQSMVSFPEITSHGALVLGALVYMGILSPPLFGIFLAAFALTILFYRFPLTAGFRRLKAAREEQDELYEHFRGATDGTKELKLHRDRRQGFLAALAANADRLRRLLVSGNMILTAAIAGAWTFFFVAVGLVVFLGPTLGDLSRDALVGYALVLLFMRGPLQLVVSSLPTLARGGVAVEKIERLGLWLGEQRREVEAAPGPPPPDWRRLELDGVVHHYRGEAGDAGFTVGPIDLAFEPGELVFLTGGNGSGKTTLAKILLGLYVPDEGVLRLDGEPLTRESADRYRQRFAAVFFDFHLFRGLLGVGGPDRDADAHQYLQRLELDDKVAVRDGELTTTALSQGQRKRLALLTAYLEDRPLYLFDEWAADQDPHFKEVFYRQLLPELKARGKTVIVISHDDRYYGVADRIVKLRDGRVVYDGPAAELESAPALEAALA